jgi:hypothetical protein
MGCLGRLFERIRARCPSQPYAFDFPVIEPIFGFPTT